MSSETSNVTSSSEPPSSSANDTITELSLGLPGESRGRNLNLGTKRRLSDLKLGATHPSATKCAFLTKSPQSKEQVVGWPPVRSYRKNMTKSDCKYVKVAVDGAPYLRKVDLEVYTGYQQLLCAFEDLFSGFTIRNVLKLMEYVPTYEDKDGDWMLVGDVPWKMFVESCKRIRLMKNSESVSRTPLKPSST